MNAIAPINDDRFDWSDECVIIPDQAAIAVYVNPFGAVVIREQRPWDRDEDTFIVVQPANLRRLVGALIDLCKYVEGQR
jgi:hypothetical protein